jgi:VPDSG-CTERM motif
MKTNKALATGVAVIAFAVAVGPSAFGATITITANDGYRTGVGGEFTVTPNDGAAVGALGNYSPLAKVDPSGSVGWGFQSFCLEYTEHFNPGSTYDYVISPGASFGGPGGNGSIDLISRGTAWLYSQFASGTLAGYVYTPGSGRSASAGALQNAIWWLENEIDLANHLANPFIKAAIDFYGADVRLDAFANQGVAALNLTYTDNRGTVINRQDQLILVPDGGMTVVLLGMVLTGLGLMRRRLS